MVDVAAHAGASAVKLRRSGRPARGRRLPGAGPRVGALASNSSRSSNWTRQPTTRLLSGRAPVGLAVMATPFSLAAVDLLARAGVDA